MSTPGVNLVKWFPPVDDHLTPEQSALHLRQLYTATNQHDQAIETVDQKVEKLSAAMTTTAAATTSTNTSTTITITEIEGFGNLAAVNNQTGQTSYTVQSSDNGSLVVLSDASPIAVTLNSVVMAPYFVFIANQGAGTATLSASSGSINGTTTIPGESSVIAFYDGANWWIWWINTVTGVFPVNTPGITHEWINSYNSTTGVFTQTQPAFSDISGSATATQLPASVQSGTIGIVIDGGGSTPATGAKGYVQVNYAGTITGWTMLADQSGSAQITVSKGAYSAFPTLSSIDAALPPKLVSVQKNTSTTLTGWTTSISAGDVLGFNLDSVTTCQRIILELQVTKA